jgi:membrane protein DedA with SNARE-associated domain/rhodanese-related sulfurtransferase
VNAPAIGTHIARIQPVRCLAQADRNTYVLVLHTEYMSDLLSLIAHHGYGLLFLIVFAEAIGLPLPAALALIAAGAAVASGSLQPLSVYLLAISGMLLGDTILFVLGSYTGWWLLGFLCMVSVSPETCILRAAESFYKRGRATLVIAKFIPGVNAMAPPLAGSMKMPFVQFLGLDLAGASLYTVAYCGVGFVFRDFVAAIMRGFQAAGHAVEIVAIGAVIVFAIHSTVIYRKNRVYRIVPRVQVAELESKLQSKESARILLADARSHGYYDSGALRIQGSIRIEPNNLSEAVKKLPRDKDIYLYCTCQREATSARVAHILREQGFIAFVIVGGLTAWRKAGYPLETVPDSDLVHLPTFSRPAQMNEVK